MSLSRFVETLLIRDVLSYFIPGTLITLIVTGFNLDFGVSQFFITAIRTTVGDVGVIFGCTGIVYVIGYMASTLIFYLENILPLKRQFHVPEPKPEILAILEQSFGNWVKKADYHYLAIICQNYIELKEPDYYFRKIDRLILMRNFEMGIASVFLTLSIVLFISFAGVLKLYGFLPLFITILLVYSSNVIKFSMLGQTFTSFYVSFQGKPLQKESKVK
ncbi:MAG: hypothetical protein IPP66_17655 [Anaerolineales bacterium]|jgi:hypothetical protein|nr:hypothetical protein [Anaerolineales bacterium]